jgi:aspartate dehydrogenase
MGYSVAAACRTMPATSTPGASVRKLMRVGLIGCGAIGKSIVERLRLEPSESFTIAALFVRAKQIADARALCARPASELLITADWPEFLAAGLDLVVEAAGQHAVVDHAQAVLEHGCDLQVLSIGALASPDLRTRLTLAARATGRSICVPAGALAGFDGLLALRRFGLESVTYTSTKPPEAWRGTIAERNFRLDDLWKSQILFRGSAMEAALSYPQNANLAAAVALAGVGFEATRVELIADPAATGNTGRVQAAGHGTRLDLTLTCQSFGDNPKTSQITAVSVLSSIENSLATVRFV